MITVNIKGGLGNQMFQYACGRALALRNMDRLALVRTQYSNDVQRPFSLAHFNIQANWSDGVKAPFFPKWRERVRQKITGDFKVSFDPKISTLVGNVYLDGYFQSELYFQDHEATIRRDLTLKVPLTGNALQLTNDIEKEPNSVSLHARRGDYLSNPDFGDIADRKYYERAVSYIKQLMPAAKFYVFSDDIEWCRKEMPFLTDVTFISRPGLQDFEEMSLMSKCRHHITANSSFSWWGAWLGQNPEKIVIAPARWSKLHEAWYRDIIPSKWKRL